MRKLSVSVLVVAACAAVLSACASNVQKNESAAPAKAVRAELMTVQKAPVQDFFVVPGTVYSRQRTEVASKIMGRLNGIFCQEGTEVKKGQLLFEVDNRDALARLSKDEADLSAAECDRDEAIRQHKAAEFARAAANADLVLATQIYERYKELLKRNSVSQQEYDNIYAKYQSAGARVEQAQEEVNARQSREKRAASQIERARAAIRESQVELTFARVTAPSSGIVAVKHANPGDMAMPGAPILTIDLEQYRLHADIDESRIKLLHKGDKVPVTIDAVAGGEMTALVDEIVPSADPSTRSFTVKLPRPASPGWGAGMFGRARLSEGAQDIIALPRSAIVEHDQLSMVYVVDSDRIARMRLVKTGKSYGNQVEILSGLTSGENVVVSKLDGITDGIKVEL
jgi:multidrug efflux pump subunit AcrA (membrane-fusion protein)